MRRVRATPGAQAPTARRWTPRHVGALVVGAVAIVAVASPVLWSTDRDSYPLSTYPMFANDRGRVAAFATAVGIDAQGAEHFLSPSVIAATTEPVQAGATVAREIRAGRAEALCRAIAGDVEGADPALTRIEVVTASYDVVAWFDDVRTPVARTVHASCDVSDANG